MSQHGAAFPQLQRHIDERIENSIKTMPDIAWYRIFSYDLEVPMSNQWLIIAAIGEKGVRYGANHNFPPPIFELYATGGIPLGLDHRGAVIYFLQSRSTFKQIEQFLERAEAIREALPLLSIGLAWKILNRPFDWFGLAKQKIEISSALENLALERAHGPQNYRQTLEYIEVEFGVGPMLKVWR